MLKFYDFKVFSEVKSFSDDRKFHNCWQFIMCGAVEIFSEVPSKFSPYCDYVHEMNNKLCTMAFFTTFTRKIKNTLRLCSHYRHHISIKTYLNLIHINKNVKTLIVFIICYAAVLIGERKAIRYLHLLQLSKMFTNKQCKQIALRVKVNSARENVCINFSDFSFNHFWFWEKFSFSLNENLSSESVVSPPLFRKLLHFRETFHFAQRGIG